MSFPTVSAPVLSPSLNEYDLPVFTDDQGNTLPIFAVIQPDANGVTGLLAANVTPEPVSQVTAKRQSPQVGASKLPLAALVAVNPTTGALVPFSAALAASASKVTGKFQSTVQTGTGSSQNIPHGLGVTPTLVLVAAYDTTDAGIVAAGYSIVEGAHDSTNVKVTATTNLQYKVIAFA